MTAAAREHFPVLPLGEWARNPNRACVQPGVDPTVFFPRRGAGAESDVPAARAICRRCPVRVECGNDALDHSWVTGVWGGTTAAERRVMRAQGSRVVQ